MRIEHQLTPRSLWEVAVARSKRRPEVFDPPPWAMDYGPAIEPRYARSSPGKLLGRREEVDRLQRQQLAIYVIELWRILDPQLD